MTALIFVLSMIFGAFWYAEHGRILFDGVTIYVAAFVATLASAAVAALVSRERRNILAALVLIAHFVAGHYAWQASDPMVMQAVVNIVTAGWFVLVAVTVWEFALGAMFASIVGAAILTALGILPGPFNRPTIFIAMSYPDVAAIIGHVANCTLGAASGDAGKLVRLRALDTRNRTVGAGSRRSLAARLAAMAARSVRRR